MNNEQAKFTKMIDGTEDDYKIIGAWGMEHTLSLSGRLLEHMSLLKGDTGGFAVDRLTHCLQTATRAHKDGRDTEYVVCALLHDIGDTLGPSNHADIAASILEPYVSEENHWIVKHHGIFQGYYFFHFLGLDKNMRDKYKNNKHFDKCAEFCAKYDQNSFDPDYESYNLYFFIPMVEEVFRAPKKSIYNS